MIGGRLLMLVAALMPFLLLPASVPAQRCPDPPVRQCGPHQLECDLGSDPHDRRHCWLGNTCVDALGHKRCPGQCPCPQDQLTCPDAPLGPLDCPTFTCVPMTQTSILGYECPAACPPACQGMEHCPGRRFDARGCQAPPRCVHPGTCDTGKGGCPFFADPHCADDEVQCWLLDNTGCPKEPAACASNITDCPRSEYDAAGCPTHLDDVDLNDPSQCAGSAYTPCGYIPDHMGCLIDTRGMCYKSDDVASYHDNCPVPLGPDQQECRQFDCDGATVDVQIIDAYDQDGCYVHCPASVPSSNVTVICPPVHGPDGCPMAEHCVADEGDCASEEYDDRGCRHGAYVRPEHDAATQILCDRPTIDGCFQGYEVHPINNPHFPGCPNVCPTHCDARAVKACPQYRLRQDTGLWCPVEGLCLDPTWGRDDVRCPDVCPKFCNPNTEVLCEGGIDENGCKVEDTCLFVGSGPDVQVLKQDGCPIHCPAPHTLPTEMVCLDFDPETGCKTGEHNVPKYFLNQVGWRCDNYCPETCPDGTQWCEGLYGHDGCQDQGWCSDNDACPDPTRDYDQRGCPNGPELWAPGCDEETEMECWNGHDPRGCDLGLHCCPRQGFGCPEFCPDPCGPGQRPCGGGVDRYDCEVPHRCINPDEPCPEDHA